MKKVLLGLCFIIIAKSTSGQKFIHKDFWVDINESKIESRSEKVKIPKVKRYRAIGIDFPRTKDILDGAPHESETTAAESKLFIEIPLPDGRIESFSIVRTRIMDPEMEAQFPEIKTFMGESINNPAIKIFLDYTLAGFHAMIYNKGKLIIIDPVYKGETEYYYVYNKSDSQKDENWSCDTESNNDPEPKEDVKLDFRANACNKFRNYRLAIATTFEYSQYHGGSTPVLALVASAVTTSVNRVSGVYIMEVGCRLTLVANTSNMFYLTSGDPYTNNNGSTMLTENQTTCNLIIGSTNYDIGHVFSTGGGGVAYLGCVCNSNKAGGVTGSTAPIGDNFDIDYVAHEMGHQFGGDHTFASNVLNCSGNGVTSSNVEPGSGTTIMAYAGICGTTNVQAHSDAYFSFRSLDQIITKITTGDCSTAVPNAMTNTAPSVSIPISRYYVPVSTPFVLTASGSDPNGDAFTYCWEQKNTSTSFYSSAPTSTQAAGPVFRSYSPVDVPYRYFPKFSDVLSGANGSAYEVLPSIARNLGFRAVVRDNPVAPSGQLAFGCFSEANTTVTTVSGIGPFVVTSPAAGVNWTPGSNQTITWNVAGTTGGTVNCPNVDISISTDNGTTWSLLAANTPNDGVQAIIAPNVYSSAAYVAVQCSNNIFYDVNPGAFTLAAGISTTCQQITNPSIVPIGITPNITISSANSITLAGTVSDVNICNVSGIHSYISDLSFYLIGPTGTSAPLASGLCTSNDNFNLGFDTQSTLAYSAIPCPMTSGLYYQPSNSLNAFNGQNAAGTWTMRIVDGADGDGGQLSSWCLNVCAQTLIVFPVSLTSFDVKASEKSIRCSWKTSSEKNNAGFAIERSLDGISNFEEIGWVSSLESNSITDKSYAFDDKNVNPDTRYYYRLAQRDFADVVSYSAIKNAILSGQQKRLTVYPNPVQDKLILALPGSSKDINISVFNPAGVLLYNHEVGGSFDQFNYEIDSQSWPKGIYILEFTESGKKQVHRINKQ